MVQECEFGTGCHASLKCSHERGTVNRAWQQAMPSDPKAGFIKFLITKITLTIHNSLLTAKTYLCQNFRNECERKSAGGNERRYRQYRGGADAAPRRL